VLPCQWNSIRDAVIGNKQIFGLKFDTKFIETANINYLPIEELNNILNTNIKNYGIKRGGKSPSI
jgi:hypothetical protein